MATVVLPTIVWAIGTAGISAAGELRASPSRSPELSRARYLMGTVCEISVAGSPQAASQIDSAFAEAARIEHLLTTWSDDSELARLNAAPDQQPIALSPELYDLLRATLDWSERTAGAFNPLVRPLIDAWQTRGRGRLPTARELAGARSRTSVVNVELIGESRVVKRGGAQFEEGGFGKGFALDRMLLLLDRAGARRVLINFGGQIAVSGDREHTDVAIASPDDRIASALSVRIPAGSLSTSSGSEKHFQIDGKRYSHIIDPRSGSSLDWGGSVTVFAFSALDADVLSTALYVMGPVDGKRWAQEHDVAALFLVPAIRARGFDTQRTSRWAFLIQEDASSNSGRGQLRR